MAKSDSIEKLRRLRIVQEWILKDYFTSDIVAQCVAKWGVSDRQAMRYVADARSQFEDVTKIKLTKRLAYHIARRQKMMQDMSDEMKKTPQGLAVQLDIIQDMADLERLYKIQIEHAGPKGAAIPLETTHKVIFEKYAE